MMKTLGIVAALYCLAILCSCQKEVESHTDIPVTDTTAAGEGYMPLTAGTYWVYKDSGFSNAYDTSTVLDEDTIINTITFTKVHTVSAIGDNDAYYAIKDHKYYFSIEEDSIPVTMLVLNDTASVGSSWEYDMGAINGVPTRGTGTTVEKLATFTVQGKTYAEVIHTQYVLAFNFLGTYTDFATYDFYFAKGIGVVRSKVAISDVLGTGDGITATQELIDYSIK
ncbi:hypothetical protein FC093_13865 [Ilyomonas limi]|uniref:Uncharacterized protein n=1 Tax=Ilyomonas limi TaxID=2575867 RepID=A0A4U3KZX6_9BACT|nr:hypothetical protein [Ilyomonas limi]TKK67384.1 hypothetical protein FC093_13865 [Ilyomonas limi]